MPSAKRVVLTILGLSDRDGGRPARRTKPPKNDAPVNLWVRPSLVEGNRPPDLEVVQPDRGFGAAVGRWGLRVLLWLVIVAGAYTLFVRPFVNRQSEAAPPTLIDTAAAQGAATRMALDYLTSSPGGAADRAAALGHDVVAGADLRGMAWNGSGYVSADTAIPGAVMQRTSTTAVVLVDVRVRVAAPKAGPAPTGGSTPAGPSAAGPSAASTTVGVPGNAPGLPAGYQLVRVSWVRLAVPVVQISGGEVRAAVAGPVFVGEPPAAPATGVGDGDAAATASTTSWVADFLKAYALGDVAYQVESGTHLAGLGAAVTPGQVQTWSLSAPNAAGQRIGQAQVVWKVAGVDLAITQTYVLTVTQDSSRWYVGSVGPVSGAVGQ